MKKEMWRVWYLENNRCRKAHCIEVEVFNKQSAYEAAKKQHFGLEVYLNAFEAPDDDGI